MRKPNLVLTVIALALAGWACGRSTPAPPTAPPTDSAIGTVTRIETIIRQGPDESSLNSVSGTNPLNDGDYLQVTDGGKGLMDFGSAIRITIFNDTNLGNVRTEAAPGSPLKLRLLLQKGGFLGTVNPGMGAATIDTPNNGEINVVGTTFFAIYDETIGTTIVGNFDGAVNVSSGGIQTSLTPGFYLAFSGGPPGPEIPIPFTPADFESEADLLDSPITGFARLIGQDGGGTDDPSERADPAELASFFLGIGGCTAVAIVDGSPEAEEDVRVFSEVFIEGGCEILASPVIPPGADVAFMLETLEAVANLGPPYILYYPIDQPTADLFFEVTLEFGKLEGSWLVDAEGVKQEGFPVVD